MQDLIQKLEKALFPEAEKRDGFNVSADAYYNIGGAIYDLKRMGADAVCIRTLERIEEQLYAARKLLRAPHSQPSDDKAGDLANGAETT